MSWQISKAAMAHLQNGSGGQTSPLSGPCLPPAKDLGWLQKYDTVRTFRDNLCVHFRPIRPEDELLLKELFYSHSEQTIMHRYFAPIHDLSTEQLTRFLQIDYHRDFALVGLIPRDGGERMVSVGRYYRCGHAPEAEVAITLHDYFQGRGIGTFLTRSLVKIAMVEHHLTAFRASVLTDNPAMLHVFHKMADKVEMEQEAGVFELRFPLLESAWPKDA